VISKKKIIFDFGSNNGQNLNYFLQKAEIVVSVEANTILTEKIKKNFSNYINNNSLFVENIALSTIDGFQDFYIDKENDVLSSLLTPNINRDFKKITIPSVKPSNIINKYLDKLSLKEIEYIKVDVEGTDYIVLDDLFKNNIFPKFISAEVQDSRVISLILNSPYKSFKFIEGIKIGKEIKTIKFLNFKQEMTETYFTEHSSGPFGPDIPGKYYTKNSVINYFLNNGLGWKDICCSLNAEEYNENIEYDESVHSSGFKDQIKKIYPAFKKMLKKRINNIIKK